MKKLCLVFQITANLIPTDVRVHSSLYCNEKTISYQDFTVFVDNAVNDDAHKIQCNKHTISVSLPSPSSLPGGWGA